MMIKKTGEFSKIIIFDGNINIGEVEKNFEFFTGVHNASSMEPKDWSWIIVNSFLSHAACSFDGDEEKILFLSELRIDIVNKLIK